jgi:hypothetical protein
MERALDRQEGGISSKVRRSYPLPIGSLDMMLAVAGNRLPRQRYRIAKALYGDLKGDSLTPVGQFVGRSHIGYVPLGRIGH